MKRFTRRDFLKVFGLGTAASAAVLALAGCGSTDTGTSSGSAQNNTTQQNTGSASSTGITGGTASNGTTTVNGTPDTPTNESKDLAITIGLVNNVQTLDPFARSDNNKNMIMDSIYLRLGEVDENGDVHGMVIKEWNQVDLLHHHITIYDNIYDANGEHITMDDVAFCFESFKTMGSAYAYVDSVTVESETEGIINLSSTTLSEWLDLVNGPFIVSQKSYEATEMSVNPVATGPYYVDEFVASSHCVLRRNEDWWQKDDSLVPQKYKANIAVARFDFITEATQVDIALDEGRIQMAWKLDSSLVPNYEGRDDVAVAGFHSGMLRALCFAGSGSVFGESEKLRQAVCYAIDREAMFALCAHGRGVLNNVLASSISTDYNPEWDAVEPYPYDLEKAKALVKESGYDGRPVTILLVNNALNNAVGDYLINQLGQIGINLELDVTDGATFNQYIDISAHQYDMMINSLAVKAFVVNSWTNLFDRRVRSSGMTLTGFVDDTLQAYIEEASDPEAYNTDVLDKIVALLNETAYAYPLFDDEIYVGTTSKISNIYINKYGLSYPMFGACSYSADYDITSI